MTRGHPLILASSSPYRRAVLKRLGLGFHWRSPDIDESPLPGEAPDDLVRRLSEAKATAVAGQYSEGLVIGSDQVASSAAASSANRLTMTMRSVSSGRPRAP